MSWKYFAMALIFTGGCALYGEDSLNLPQTHSAVVHTIEHVSEDFVITEVTEDTVQGDVLNPNGPQGAEGIWLEKGTSGKISIEPKYFHVGEVIRVTWGKEDYENGIWDNIQAVEIL